MKFNVEELRAIVDKKIIIRDMSAIAHVDHALMPGKQIETQKTQKAVANSSSSSAPPLLPPATVKESHRPAGQKKGKQKLRQHSSIKGWDYLLAKKIDADAEKERCKKAFALQEERIRLEREKFEFRKDQFQFYKNLEEERIMNVDTNHLCTKQQQFYEGLKKDILARRLNKYMRRCF